MNNKGSVTVYIVLIFSVLIILVTSVISVLRYEYEKMNSLVTLNISQEAAFSKYYRPLLNEYGMYYYICDNEEAVRADIMSYISKNQSGITNILSFVPSGLSITKMYHAVDDEGDNVKSQMRAVVNDTFVQEEIEKLTKKYSDCNIRDNSNIIRENKEKIQADVSEAKNEEKMLKLLKLVEGITVSGGDITCEKVYAKCALAGKVTSANAGIDNPDVWNAVKDKSYDMTEYLLNLNKKAKKAVKGKKVKYSESKTSKWCSRLKEVYEVTKQAKALAGEIRKVKKGICKPRVIENALAADISILESLLHLQDIQKPESVEDWENIYTLTSEYLKLAKSYHVKDMSFDYSTLNLTKADNPAKETDGDVNDMITFLLGDKDNISKKHVSNAGLYENQETDKLQNIPQIDFDNIEELPETIDECIVDTDKNSSVNSLYIQMYIDRFFTEYMCGTADSDNKKEAKKLEFHKLNYEKEYILNAGKSDRDNLKAVTYRILMIRMGTSFAYLVTDAASQKKAYAAAAAVVGFTGMDAIVRCVQYLILAAWAYQDACVDTGIVLSGKNIPLVKNKSCLNIRFEEIPLFGKRLVREKVNAYKSKNGMSYSDYLNVFLLAASIKKRVYRSMDIIQFNMKKNYDNMFSFQKAVYGADTKLLCEKPFIYTVKSSYRYR